MNSKLIKKPASIEYVPKYVPDQQKMVEALRILKDAKPLLTNSFAEKSS